jgi:hypothetical protein
MGCFTSTRSKSFILLSDRLCTYNRSSKISIKLRNKIGNIIGTQAICFQVPDPVSINSKEISFGQDKLLISSCVLPGIDPRGEYKKKCQDNCFYLFDESGVLCCLFDGHGSQGERVAEFCQEIIEKLFIEEKQLLHVR